MTLSYVLPILLVVVSNIIYHLCAKSVPTNLNPYASLVVSYSISAVISLVLFFVTNKGHSLIKEYQNINWAPFVLGIAIVGLEAGFLLAYKAGWSVSTASVTQSSLLAIALIFVGYLIFKESITWNKVLGIVICCIGLVFINLKK